MLSRGAHACQRLLVILAIPVLLGLVGCKPKSGKSSIAGSEYRVSGEQTYNAPKYVPFAEKEPLPAPLFDYFEELDKSRIATKFAEYRAPIEALPRPEGMDDDVFERCQRILADKSDATPITTFDKQDIGEIKGFSFIENNKYIVTLGDKLNVWRIEDKKKVRSFELPDPEVSFMYVGKERSDILLASKSKLYKFSFAESKVKAEVKVPEGILGVDLAYESGDVAVCTAANHLLVYSADLTGRVEGPSDLTLKSPQISIHPSSLHVLCNTDSMVRWQINPSEVQTMGGMVYYPDASVPSAGCIFDRWVSPFAINEFRDGDPTRSMSIAPGAPSAAMDTMIVSHARCSSSVFGDWCLLLTYDKERDPKKMSVIDAMPNIEAASVPTRLSDEPITSWCATRSGDRIAFMNSSGLHVVQRMDWVCHTGAADALSIALLLEEGRLEQLELAAEYIRKHKRLSREISGEEVYANIITSAAQSYGFVINAKNLELMNAIEKWREKGSVASILINATMHLQVASRARGEHFSDSVTREDWQVVINERQVACEELDKLDFSVVQPAVAYSLSIGPDSDFVSSKASTKQMLLDYTHSYPWHIDVHINCCVASMPRWGGSDRQMGAYASALAAAYPPSEAEWVYTYLATCLRSTADEIDGEDFGLNFERMRDGLRAMMKNDSLRQSIAERAFYASKRTINDASLVKELAEYHVRRFDMLKSTSIPAQGDADIFKARNRLYYGEE